MSIILVCPRTTLSHFTSTDAPPELDPAEAAAAAAAAFSAAAALPLIAFLTVSFCGYSPRSHPHSQQLPFSSRQQQLISRTEREVMRRKPAVPGLERWKGKASFTGVGTSSPAPPPWFSSPSAPSPFSSSSAPSSGSIFLHNCAVSPVPHPQISPVEERTMHTLSPHSSAVGFTL